MSFLVALLFDKCRHSLSIHRSTSFARGSWLCSTTCTAHGVIRDTTTDGFRPRGAIAIGITSDEPSKYEMQMHKMFTFSALHWKLHMGSPWSRTCQVLMRTALKGFTHPAFTITRRLTTSCQSINHIIGNRKASSSPIPVRYVVLCLV